MWPAVSNGFKLHLLDETAVAKIECLWDDLPNNAEFAQEVSVTDSLIYIFE